MALDGVNVKCGGCTQECKQFKQVKVVHCPSFEEVKKQCIGDYFNAKNPCVRKCKYDRSGTN